MKIVIIGSGAIGGLLGAKLANGDHDVTLVDRGEHLAAMQKKGLKIINMNAMPDQVVKVRACSIDDSLDPQDIIILAVKTHQLTHIVEKLPQFFHEHTMVITLQNGIPWWYFQRHGGIHENYQVQSVDAANKFGQYIDSRRIIGCVPYPAAEIVAPGEIKHIEGIRLPLGELDGSTSDRVSRLADIFNTAGFKSPVLENLRAEIWLKLWGTLAFNPISALTGATLEDICRYSDTRNLVINMMSEAELIANSLGIKMRLPLEKRVAGAERVGAHKTSTLVDIENHCTTELDAILKAVIELGRLTENPTPNLEAVYACSKLLEKTCLNSAK